MSCVVQLTVQQCIQYNLLKCIKQVNFLPKNYLNDSIIGEKSVLSIWLIGLLFYYCFSMLLSSCVDPSFLSFSLSRSSSTSQPHTD